jgi:L-lactate dehydrogenase complex protein LldG
MVAKTPEKGIGMSTARENTLAKIRGARVPDSLAQEAAYAGIRREYRQAGALNREESLRLFEERLRDYEATVYHCTADRIAETVAKALAARGKRRLVIAENVSKSWLPEDFDFVPGDRLTYEELDASDGVLTGCAAAIAVTGTIVLEHSSGQGSRRLTLIPDYHLCVVFANQVHETVPEAIRKVAASASPITTISGPSATSDIEMTRVKGVHGPRHFDVIVVQE